MGAGALMAGRLDRRVELQQFTLAGDGDPTSGTWAVTATVWAGKMNRAQAERFVGSQELGTATAIYRIRYRTAVDPNWRLRDGTDLWDIEGAVGGSGRNTETLLLVSRHDPGDSSA